LIHELQARQTIEQRREFMAKAGELGREKHPLFQQFADRPVRGTPCVAPRACLAIREQTAAPAAKYNCLGNCGALHLLVL
jgi:hypothetical protein